MKHNQKMPPALTKRQRKRLNARSTPGSDKGENCQATPLEKGIAKRNRSYKMREYGSIQEKWANKRKKYGG